MSINLKLEYHSANTLKILSNSNNKTYINKNMLDIYRTICDFIIKKLEEQSSSLPRR
ncbi:MAG: hypothetical protein VYE03_01155 [Nitrospinota bacterium]|nr:hypothetical protein [Nitrospinota bacterium]